MTKARSAFLALALVAAGCIELTEDYYLNADGSGKLRFQAICRPAAVAAVQPDEESQSEVYQSLAQAPEAWARQALAMLVAEAEGVEVWADLGFRLAEGGAVILHGVAYFPSLSRLWVEAPAGVEWPLLSCIPLERGWAVQFGAATLDDRQIDLPPLALAERVRLLKKEFEANRDSADRQLENFDLALTVRLPLAAREMAIFQSDSDRRILRLRYEGKKVREALRQQAQSENWWFDLAQEADGLEGGFLVKSVNEKLFGARRLARAAVDDTEAMLFNYREEIAAAKEKWPRLRAELGIAPDDAPPAPEL
ncbi:MAG: hypothetical protein N3A66_08905 [Planctomycetota bacterium]|nr:hypothetical protein [Planctomycetota bacterium]